MISLQLMCEAGWSSDQAHVRTVRPYNLSAWPRRKLSLGAHHWLSVRQAAELMSKQKVTPAGGISPTIVGLMTLLLTSSAFVNDLR
jgi:hypothetical protein